MGKLVRTILRLFHFFFFGRLGSKSEEDAAEGLTEENPEGGLRQSEYSRLRLSLKISLEKLPGYKSKVGTA